MKVALAGMLSTCVLCMHIFGGIKNMILSTIRTGTYFGECLINCNEIVTITPEKIHYLLTGNVKDPQHPDITVEKEMSKRDWESLQDLIDLARFNALPSIIGQPDRADQGGEWVEITVDGTKKRIDFELNASVPEIHSLLKRLREIRNQISRK